MKIIHVLCAVAIGTAGVGLAMPSAQAATITVTAGQSIQTAIDNANPGDTIKVGAGTFHEAVVVYKDDLTVIGHNTVIQPPTTADFGVCISFSSICGMSIGTVFGVSVTGITEQKSTDDGFVVSGAQNTTLTNDRALNNVDSGFAVFDSSTVTLSQDVATGNKFAGFNVGAVQGLIASGDQAIGNAGYGFVAAQVFDLTLQNSIAKGNCAGVAIELAFANTLVTNNALDQNTKPCPGAFIELIKGAGAAFVDDVNVTFTHNSLQGNGTASNYPYRGGLVVADTPADAANVFTANAFANNLPFDIRADDTNPADNAFTHNACHTSSPSGLCP
jgi:hypothetical protein